MKNRLPLKYLVVHCSATKPKTHVDAAYIDTLHKQRGFAKIGYHYVVLRDGSIQNGREDTEVGAHVSGKNTGSLGICLVGGLNDTTGKPENNFTGEQFKALRNLLIELCETHPKARVRGHRDLSPDLNKNGKIETFEWVKECPCFDVTEWWELEKE